MNNLSGTDWQKSIYVNGFSGAKPLIEVDFEKLEQTAKTAMTPEAYAYISGGAGTGSTMRANRDAFAKYKIVPRMLRDVSVRDMSITLFGKKLSSPLLLSPVGVLEMVHEQADLAVAKAAAELGMPCVYSNQASKSMEACAHASGDSAHWFQLYWSKSNDLVVSFVERAEKCGCSAIVVTLDTTMLGWRTRDLEIGYLPFMEGKGIAQYTSDPVFQRLLDEPEVTEQINRKINWQSVTGLIAMVNNYPGIGFVSKLKSGRPIKAVRKFVSMYSNPAVTWEDLTFLRKHTKLPILLKGILHADDAQKAIDYGMDGIIVSNHGGRQVDGSIGTLEALPSIVERINAQLPVLIDSGFRSGADVFKALALGANAVCIGRPYVYGLAVAGSAGVYHVLRNLLAEFELTMGLSGCKNISEIKRDMVTPES